MRSFAFSRRVAIDGANQAASRSSGPGSWATSRSSHCSASSWRLMRRARRDRRSASVPGPYASTNAACCSRSLKSSSPRSSANAARLGSPGASSMSSALTSISRAVPGRACRFAAAAKSLRIRAIVERTLRRSSCSPSTLR